jgi:hypothetical protein
LSDENFICELLFKLIKRNARSRAGHFYLKRFQTLALLQDRKNSGL